MQHILKRVFHVVEQYCLQINVRGMVIVNLSPIKKEDIFSNYLFPEVDNFIEELARKYKIVRKLNGVALVMAGPSGSKSTNRQNSPIQQYCRDF